jgi:glutamine synthetase
MMDTEGKRLRLLYPDIHGLERGKYLFGEGASTGTAAFCIGVYPLTHDKEILGVPRTQVDVGLHDIDATLDRDTVRPGWEPETVVGIADIALHGEPAPWDTRHALRQACAVWQDMDLEPQVAFELEFYLLEPAESGGWRPVSIPGHRVYGTGMAVDPSGTISDVVDTALACGFPVESWCSEYDNDDYEVNIRYDDAITAADESFMFKLLVR